MGFYWRSVQDCVLHMCKTLSQLKQNFAAVAVAALAQLSFRCACREKLSFKDSFSLARLTVRALPFYHTIKPHRDKPHGVLLAERTGLEPVHPFKGMTD